MHPQPKIWALTWRRPRRDQLWDWIPPLKLRSYVALGFARLSGIAILREHTAIKQLTIKKTIFLSFFIPFLLSCVFQKSTSRKTQSANCSFWLVHLLRVLLLFLNRTDAFHPLLAESLILSQITNDFMRPPQAEASGRQRSRNSGQAHFITPSKKGVSEPSKVGKFGNDTG